MSNTSGLWQPQSWETMFFGVKTARIVGGTIQAATLEQILTECQIWGAQVVHFLADADHDASVRLAEQTGFHLVDLRMTYEWQTTTLSPGQISGDILLRDHLPSDLPALQVIARSSYGHSRYYYDQHYARERCDDLYAEWIAKSCRETAERVLVAEQGGELIGYLTYHLDKDSQRGYIGLVGIRADARGNGVGRFLVHGAQEWFGAQGARVVSVITQGRNISAQRLYQRRGFITSMVQLWYHKWFH